MTGFCDYLIGRSPSAYYLRSPLVAVVEAKREVIGAGLGQCLATMVAVRLFNERDGRTIPVVYGCVTTGSLWRFLKLEDSAVKIDCREYALNDLGTILGILVRIGRGDDHPAAGAAA